MPYVKQICLAFVLVCALFSTAAAQDSTTAKTTLTITANATGERVRVTAPSSVVQLHLEVYAAGGEKVFDQELRGANIFDWHLQNGQAQRVPAGDYVCVVTAKTISGKLTQKIGAVTVAENSASVRPGNPQQLSLPQTQAIGPVEEDSSWIIPGNDQPQTPTVIANNGSDGQMIRGRGALTFRVGNFFSGVDTEQMRLTEAGDLGIGTSQPQSKLEVAGTIRAERFLVVKPSLGNGDKTATATQTTEAVDGVQPLVAGTGTQNQITKWTDNAGTLGDSVITETPAGRVGVGIVSPLSKFHLSSTFDAMRLTSTNDTTPVWAQFNTSLGSGLGYFGVEGNTPGTFLAGTLPYATALSSGGSGTALQLGSAGSVKMTILSGGNVGIGTVNPTARLHVSGDLLFENKWRTETTTVNPGSVPGPPNLIGGFLGTGSGGATPGNRVTTDVVGATIGGGGFNGTINFPSTIVPIGDNSNRVTDWFGTVGGGLRNRAGDDAMQLDSAIYATVGGGALNTASGQAATVGAGYSNTAGGNGDTVGGGAFNTTNGNGATVGGGSQNTVSNFNATVGGGFSNEANDDYATVGGGSENTASGEYSTVGGGYQNTASGDNATVPGGVNNTASGVYSFAAGRQAFAQHQGVFVWADSTAANFGSSAANQFLIRASGGVGIGTSTPDQQLTVDGGASKPGGGSWLIYSDERLKTIKGRFTPGLKALMQLQPIRYSYQPDNALGLKTRGEFVGFGAQAVQRVIPEAVIKNDKGYLLVNNDPILWTMLNAIKEQQQEIEILQAQNAELRTGLRSMEKIVRRRRGSSR